MSVQFLHPFLNQVVCFAIYLYEFLVYFGPDRWFANYFLPIHRLPFHFIDSFVVQKLFILFYFFLKIYLLIDWLLCWVFVSVRGLPVVAASGGHSSSRCAGLSLSQPLLLRSTGSRRAGSVVVAHGPSCSAACGIFPDQGANPCPLHWQADSQPLRHQGSPEAFYFDAVQFINFCFCCLCFWGPI